LKAGLSSTDSPRALISSANVFGSLTQDGSNPQRTSAKRRLPFSIRTIAIGWVGAML
jgi:hypothetical protein